MGLPVLTARQNSAGATIRSAGHKPRFYFPKGRGFYVPKGAVESHIMSMSHQNNESPQTMVASSTPIRADAHHPAGRCGKRRHRHRFAHRMGASMNIPLRSGDRLPSFLSSPTWCARSRMGAVGIGAHLIASSTPGGGVSPSAA